MLFQNDRCGHRAAGLTSNRTSSREIAVAVVCGGLLLAVLMLAGYVAIEWMERHGFKVFEDPVWHEPLDSWSL